MNKSREDTIAPRPGEPHIKRSYDVTLRVNNLKAMKQFYQEVLGFQLLGEFPSAVLLKVANVSGDQVQMLALLQRSMRAETHSHSIGRIALVIPIDDRELEKKRLQCLGLKVDETNHEGSESRSLCFHDPEGNEVKLLFSNPPFAR